MLDLQKFPYKNIRDNQKYILEEINKFIDDETKQYFIINAPTGVGKSAIAKTICDNYKSSFIITETKQLQDQYVKDFGSEIVSIKGKANYKCNKNLNLNCECGPCILDFTISKKCKKNNECQYYSLRKKALNSPIVVTSYAYALRAWECAGFWRKRDILIFDEAHSFENQLTSWGKVELIPSELQEKYELFNGFDPRILMQALIPPNQKGKQNNLQWITSIYNILLIKRNEKLQELKMELQGKEIEDLEPDEIDNIMTNHKAYYDLDKIYKKLQVFMSINNTDDWLVEPYNGGLLLTPINVGLLFHFFIKKWGMKIIFMSATILNENNFRGQLGLEKNKTVYISANSTFDHEKSPIIYKPIGKMNYQHINETLPKVISEIENIMNNYSNEKGIIHINSIKNSEFIYNNISNKLKKRILIKKENETNNDLIKRHMTNKKPTVILSSSLATGVDLKDDLSRFQIIVKLPWMSLMDEKVKCKIKTNPTWYSMEMLKHLIQMCGRSTRTEEDYSTTYILDNSFYKWTKKLRNNLPDYFLNRIIWDNKHHTNNFYN